MRKKKKPGLNFYSSKGAAFDAKNARGLFFPWIVIMFLTLELLRFFIIALGVCCESPGILHEWNSHLFFGLDMGGVFQMLSLLLGAYVLAHLGVFITKPHRNKKAFYVGTALHIFGSVTCVLYVICYDMYATWLEGQWFWG